MIPAAVACGVLSLFVLITLREVNLLGDRIFDFQVYVAFAAAAAYLVAVGGNFESYVIALAVLRFVLLLWDLIDLAKIRLQVR